MRQLLFVLLIVCSAAHAQEGRYWIKAHFGYSVSNWMGTGIETQPRSTFNAGVEIQRRIGQSGFHLQSGLRWNEYGFRQMYETYIYNGEYYDVEDVDFRSTSYFLTLPFIVSYKFKEVLPGLNLSAGPQLSLYMFSKSKRNKDLNLHRWLFPPFNLGLHSAIGYERAIGERWMLGGELYSNFHFPFTFSYGFDGGNFNTGIAVSCRYLLR
jgi:hypothetical protein